MPIAPETEKDRTPALKTWGVPWRVVSVEALPGQRVRVRFADGIEGIVNMGPLVSSENAGVFQALRNPAVFEGVHVSLGAVTWPGDVDLAPDAMYDEITAYGEWTPR